MFFRLTIIPESGKVNRIIASRYSHLSLIQESVGEVQNADLGSLCVQLLDPDHSLEGYQVYLEEDEENDDVEDEIIDELNEAPQNPLLMSLVQDDKVSRKERKANMWFDKDIFKGIEDDEDLDQVERSDDDYEPVHKDAVVKLVIAEDNKIVPEHYTL